MYEETEYRRGLQRGHIRTAELKEAGIGLSITTETHGYALRAFTNG